jgi:hypothetical protein
MYKDGNFQASKVYMAKAVPYACMSGGIVPCKKADIFKPKATQ